eukprot:TRINITY_DN36921_c0_g1_i1.p1 TRINITY_DN36921_c0_g1~~TRINITY_DN36921_c0_g1_i1.p1  ORF type:complete len:132 (+),score=23.78 TRINITY_DN36921_c0_g1_i1:55-450(+)
MTSLSLRPAGPETTATLEPGSVVHPVQLLQDDVIANSDIRRLGQMQQEFGLAMPMRERLAEDVLMGCRRLAPLESNYLALDSFMGTSESIGWEDYLQAPENDDRMRGNTRHMMEEQVFGRTMDSKHSRDIF